MVLLIDSSKFFDESIGGSATFASHMLSVFGQAIAIAGFSNDNLHRGEWSIRKVDNEDIFFFNLGNSFQKKKKSILPNRLKVFIIILYNLRNIKSIGISNVFIQSPEILFAVVTTRWNSLCFRFAGIQNPVANSRYIYIRKLDFLFDKIMRFSLMKDYVHTILASADKHAIESYLTNRNYSKAIREKFIQFPTRVDLSLFYQSSDKTFKIQKGINKDDIVFITVGRITSIKGWDLIIDAFEILLTKLPNSILIFVGDGEDKSLLTNKIEVKGISSRVILTGFLQKQIIVKYLNISNVFLVGSFYEGWSLAMVEALAVGLPIISTDISGAKDLIIENENGYILSNRNPGSYADHMLQAVKLPSPNVTSLAIAKKYSVSTLKKDLGSLWPPLGELFCN